MHNEIIEEKLDEINNLRQEKYITVSCEKRDEDSAKTYFTKLVNIATHAVRPPAGIIGIVVSVNNEGKYYYLTINSQ